MKYQIETTYTITDNGDLPLQIRAEVIYTIDDEMQINSLSIHHKSVKEDISEIIKVISEWDYNLIMETVVQIAWDKHVEAASA